ncbi:hypothetical protein Bca52824_017383 [Brassica carinata]|uniref:Uncharacterized protein n=1 Tax=Brassica carinata TaxID=52824 RepID=A0A8X7VMZ7_BRACI|nr:hypothetical protein Bca52824_017383 [Brassica carinata]
MLRPRRKSLTLPFSMFNARSKAPASKILDIDSADKDNDHATVEYVENMYTFYKEVEFDLSPETFYLTISIIGRFLSLNQGPSWPDFGKKKLK